MDPLKDVKRFHELFGLPVLDSPAMPDRARCELRVALIQEELDELSQAIKDNDLVEVADALADLQYVLSGAVLEFGMAGKFPALFSEVHRSNMSKTCKTEEERDATMKHYLEDRGVDTYWVRKDGEYLVKRSSDSKGLKSVGYSPADLRTILE